MAKQRVKFLYRPTSVSTFTFLGKTELLSTLKLDMYMQKEILFIFGSVDTMHA